MKKFVTKNEKETLALAKLLFNNLNDNITFALIGNLGSGKTTFTKGLAKYLKIKENILSPTFNIIKVYTIPHNKNNYKYLCHVDAYRLQTFEDLKALGLDNYLDSLETITVIEWADKIKKYLPKNTFFIKFKSGKEETERIITFK
jgi:tRNA threonylcarbamoyladenosine biosynthesis protein TsaE